MSELTDWQHMTEQSNKIERLKSTLKNRIRRDFVRNEEIASLRLALQKIADHNFDALKGQQKDYYVALKEGMSIALAALK